jgi:hypothetical protein
MISTKVKPFLLDIKLLLVDETEGCLEKKHGS